MKATHTTPQGLRELAGLGKAGVARLIGVTRKTWWSWEQGITSPSERHQARLDELAELVRRWREED